MIYRVAKIESYYFLFDFIYMHFIANEAIHETLRIIMYNAHDAREYNF